MSLDPYKLLAGLIFGTIGLGGIFLRQKTRMWQPRAIGAALIAYLHFVTNSWLLWGIGTGLTVLLWFYHHE